MAELSGASCVIKISGAGVAMVGEATTATADLTYQITSTTKQVLDKTGTIRVQKFSANGTAEAGTNTTNIKITTHGLQVGDLICNTSRSNAYRLVTVRVDADNVTVASVASQTTGDTIARYPTEATTAYSLNRLNGKVTYASAVSRVIKISGDYLPMTTAAYAHSMSRSKAIDLLDKTQFGDTYKSKMTGLKYASGTLSQFNLADTTYSDALIAGVPVVIEDRDAAASEPNRFWALLEKDDVSAAINGVQDEIVGWTATDAWIELGI